MVKKTLDKCKGCFFLIYSNLLVATNEKGEGVYQSIIQRPSEASALINYLVSRLQENSTLTSPHYINTKAIVSID